MAVLYTPHFVQFFDNNGDPLNGGKLYTYEAGTTTPKATYTDDTGGTPLANPVVLDSAGRATIFLSGSYKFRLEDSAGNLIKQTDNVTQFQTGTGSTVQDGTFKIQNSSDTTKQVQFSAASVSTGTTTTITIPDGNFTIAKASDIVASGLTFISTATASASATLDFTGLTSTYAAYLFVLDRVKPATDNVEFNFRTSTDGGATYDAGAGNYAYSQNYIPDSGAISTIQSTSATSIRLGTSCGNATNEDVNGFIILVNPSAAAYGRIVGVLNQTDLNGNTACVILQGRRLSAADVDAVRFIMSSGNITSGNIKMYGIRAS